MQKVVKNTILERVCDTLCPFRCRGCGAIGRVLCGRCKNDITFERMNRCPKCFNIIDTKCEKCNLPFSMTFTIGVRQELLGKMVEEFKFYGVRALGNVLSEIIHEVLPDMGGEVVLVPLPTISRHIRERGLDHTMLIARNLARMRGWEVQKALIRENNTVQVGAGAKQRKEQAKKAYRVNPQVKIDGKKTYMLIDDVWTTGSSMLAAEKKLREAGVKNIACVVIVRASDK